MSGSIARLWTAISSCCIPDTKVSNVTADRRSRSTCSASGTARLSSIGAGRSRKRLPIRQVARKSTVRPRSLIVKRRRPIGHWYGRTGRRSWCRCLHEFRHIAVVAALIGGKAVHRREQVFVAETCQPWRWRAALKIRLMAWPALGDPLRERRRRGGGVLCRPALGREIGRDRAKVLLREALGDRRHDGIVALAVPVVAHLLEEIAPLLPPDDRNGLRVGRHAILAVAGGAELHLGLDIIGGVRRYGNNRETNPARNDRKKTYEHGPSSRACAPCLVDVSIQRWGSGRNSRPAGPPPIGRQIGAKGGNWACITPQAESPDAAPVDCPRIKSRLQ